MPHHHHHQLILATHIYCTPRGSRVVSQWQRLMPRAPSPDHTCPWYLYTDSSKHDEQRFFRCSCSSDHAFDGVRTRCGKGRIRIDEKNFKEVCVRRLWIVSFMPVWALQAPCSISDAAADKVKAKLDENGKIDATVESTLAKRYASKDTNSQIFARWRVAQIHWGSYCWRFCWVCREDEWWFIADEDKIQSCLNLRWKRKWLTYGAGKDAKVWQKAIFQVYATLHTDCGREHFAVATTLRCKEGSRRHSNHI